MPTLLPLHRDRAAWTVALGLLAASDGRAAWRAVHVGLGVAALLGVVRACLRHAAVFEEQRG